MASYFMEKVEHDSYNSDWSQEEESEQELCTNGPTCGEQTWYDDSSSSDFGEELDDEELEPEPPDCYCSCQQHVEPCTYTRQANWVQTNSYFCEENENANYQNHPPKREQKSHNYGVASYRNQVQPTRTIPKKQPNKRYDYTSNPLIFTALSNPECRESLQRSTKPRIRTTKPLYQATPNKVVATPKPQPIFEPKNAYSPELRRVSSSTLETPMKVEQSVQGKEVQTDSTTTFLHEP
ncbi:unnamed protein product [Arabis nemorensis]|uniref:Uncharacterized protein n=1 Tax=Arabis nemorensis TaxID=586526 RepID=A0A565BKJ0_9BRAS|nr:unnamed protein product [Arabis nemorensis]